MSSKHKQTATKTQNRSENLYVHISSLNIIQWKYIYFIYINENFDKKDYKLSITLNVLTFWKTFFMYLLYIIQLVNFFLRTFHQSLFRKFSFFDLPRPLCMVISKAGNEYYSSSNYAN